MSFGQHSYQHRYFNDRLKGKESIPRAGASLIPLSYSGNATIIDPVSYDIGCNNHSIKYATIEFYTMNP